MHLAADSLCNGGSLLATGLHEAGAPLWAATVGLNAMVAIVLVCMARPLFMACSATLLQRIPPALDPALLNRCVSRLTTVPGCKGSCHQHFWELAPGQIQGEVTLLVAPGADEGAVKAAAARIFDVALAGASQHVVFEARQHAGM
uniref:Cation efflux protein cytoplasmic domain-containing protein n=1 Tax=Tetraselmis chuii TaxID=63592 RepID=A0A7S1WYS1_9CHLO